MHLSKLNTKNFGLFLVPCTAFGHEITITNHFFMEKVHSTKIQRSWIVKRWICLYWQMCSQIFRSSWKYWQKVNGTFNERSRIPSQSRRCSSVLNRQSNHEMSDLHTILKVSVQDSLCFFFNYFFSTHDTMIIANLIKSGWLVPNTTAVSKALKVLTLVKGPESSAIEIPL